MLLLSLALMAVAVIRFAIDTKKNWASAGLYVMIALVMPIFCLGYNPYSVLEGSRAWHFDKYGYSQNGLLCVSNGTIGGLRDRYGIILPLEYAASNCWILQSHIVRCARIVCGRYTTLNATSS